jgi:FO synthase
MLHPDVDLAKRMTQAAALRDAGHGDVVTYSRKIFVPLTQLCRDVCRYCTFAKSARGVQSPFLSMDEVMAIVRAGEDAGCTEVLFTLGDKPELRYGIALKWLQDRGYSSTVDYLVACCETVLQQSGMIPHVNGGIMTREEILRLREVSASQGLMLESISERLMQPGGCHHGCPDKVPAVRLEALRIMGECQVPATTGILIGIGETWEERIDSIHAIKSLHDQYGHIQEVIVQNFCPKPGTKMANRVPAAMNDLLRTVVAAREILGPYANIQVPPNLTSKDHERLLDAGINDWGGISPVTIDHVNPEAPWPAIESLEAICQTRGKTLAMRLPVYPKYALDAGKWLTQKNQRAVWRSMDGAGLAREDSWTSGKTDLVWHESVTVESTNGLHSNPRFAPTSELNVLSRKVRGGEVLDEQEIVGLLASRGKKVDAILDLADQLRHEASGDVVRYVVNRNINYTNLCTRACTFCAFSKSGSRQLAGPAYDLTAAEITRRTAEAWQRGATEVCLQGGIHPSYSGDTYLEICRAVKRGASGIHIHAFSPLEVVHGAETLGWSIGRYLEELKLAGLGSLPSCRRWSWCVRSWLARFWSM